MFDPVADAEHDRLRRRVIKLEILVKEMAELLYDTLPPAYADDLKLLFVSKGPNHDG